MDEASAATAKVERALSIGKGLAEGKALDPAQLGLEADALLDLLERLDRQGKAKEALRLARAASKLYALLRRWLELLRALRAALRAAEKLGDLSAVGWAKHELGTLQLAGGDVAGAERTLVEARQIRERIGDADGLAATERNLKALARRLPRPAGAQAARKASGSPRTLRLLPATAIGAVLFCAGVAGGAALGGSSSAGEKAAAVTSATGTETETLTGNGATQTETETTTDTETTTVTTTETVTVEGATPEPLEPSPRRPVEPPVEPTEPPATVEPVEPTEPSGPVVN